MTTIQELYESTKLNLANIKEKIKESGLTNQKLLEMFESVNKDFNNLSYFDSVNKQKQIEKSQKQFEENINKINEKITLIEKELGCYQKLINNVNNNSLKIKSSKDKDLALKIILEAFHNHLIDTHQFKNLEEKEKFKSLKLDMMSCFQPICSEDNNGSYIAKFEVLTQLCLNNNDGTLNKEATQEFNTLLKSNKEAFLLFVSDLCYDSPNIPTNTHNPTLMDSMKPYITNALFLRNINDTLNSLETLQTTKTKDGIGTRGNKFVVTLNMGKHELNTSFFTNFIYSIDNLKDRSAIVSALRKHFELEVLEHPLDLDENILNPQEIEVKKKKWETMIKLFDKYGLKFHIDDFIPNKNMYNRTINLHNILGDKLKAIKIDKEMMIPFNISSLLKDYNKEELPNIKITEMINNALNSKNHVFKKFLEQNKIDIEEINKNGITPIKFFENHKDKIYEALNKNILEVVKVHFYNTYEISNMEEFIKEDLKKFINNNTLIDFKEINELLKSKYGSVVHNHQKELTCEYIETPEIAKELNELKKVFGHTLNLQGFYFSDNLVVEKNKEKEYSKIEYQKAEEQTNQDINLK